MLLPDNGPDFAACGACEGDKGKVRLFAWRGLIHRLRIPFRTWRAKTNPESASRSSHDGPTGRIRRADRSNADRAIRSSIGSRG